MGSADRDRHTCYGYIRDSKKNGCRWLDTQTDEIRCASCSFFKTEQEYLIAQQAVKDSLCQRQLKAIMIRKDEENFITVIPDDNV